MHRLYLFIVASLLGATLAAIVPAPAGAQEQFQFESELTAKRRIFESVGAGFREMRSGPNGNYYILMAPAPAVMIFDAKGTRIGQIPSESAAAKKGTALVYGESFDVDRDGRVVVCDRGANFCGEWFSCSNGFRSISRVRRVSHRRRVGSHQPPG
jgi:hypothetical protein